MTTSQETAQAPTRTMQAIVQERYGALEEVLHLRRIERPVPTGGEVLLRVHASSVSGSDWHLLRGLPYAARPATGLWRPKARVPGLDVAGTVEAVGPDVTRFRPGDEVYGWYEGAYAEYAAVPEQQLAPKPPGITLEQAAVVPVSAFTAIQAVRDLGRVGQGHRVLITGASGGVGGYAVQIAKTYGAEVTAVCSGAKADLVRSFGADHVIDYTREPLTARGVGYDVLIDLYGNPPLSECRRALKPGGTLVCVGGTGGRWFMGVDRWMRWLAVAPLVRLKVRALIHKDSLADLEVISGLIADGAVSPVVGTTFPLGRVAEAIAHVQQGRARGQVAIVIGAAPPA